MTTRDQRLAVGSAVCVALSIVLMLLLLQTAGCGAHVSGTLDAAAPVGYARLDGDTATGVCGELELRKHPLGVIACYDPSGRKVRVCAMWAGIEILCLPLGE